MKFFPVTMIFLGYALCIYSMFITWNIFLDTPYLCKTTYMPYRGHTIYLLAQRTF